MIFRSLRPSSWRIVMHNRIRLLSSGCGVFLIALGFVLAASGESHSASSQKVRLLGRGEIEAIHGGYLWWICVDRSPCEDPNPCPTTSTCNSTNKNPNCGIQYYPGYNNCSSTYSSGGCGNVLNGTCVLNMGGGWQWTPLPAPGTPLCGGTICNAF